MKILLTGKDGQLGRQLAQALQPLGAVKACGRAELDLAWPDMLRQTVREFAPEAIVNAAAWTNVDGAESDRQAAYAVNAEAPEILAVEAGRCGARMVHFSTDYVFDGAAGRPYTEDDAPNPVSAYGASKLEGERAVQKRCKRHLILRTSWLYSVAGNNFFTTIAEQAKQGGPLRVVDDQFGSPTSARLLAGATARALEVSDATGVFHVAAGGTASRYEFARAILEALGIACEVQPVKSAELARPARRPASSALANARFVERFGMELPDWRVALARECAEVK